MSKLCNESAKIPRNGATKQTLMARKIRQGVSHTGFLLALFSVGWQVYTYRENHEESPMVTASLNQELKGDRLQFNRDTHGKLTIEVTNLGNRTMQIKGITLSAWKRIWVLHGPDEKRPTTPLETGHTLSRQIEWDYAKYPVFELDESQPADFLVEVETTRAVHQRHVQINSINITSTLSKAK